MPGPGSKGGGAHENWKAWRGIKLNIDTFAPDTPVNTSMSLFGKDFSLPLLTGPIGTMLQYSDTDVTVDFNDGVIQAAAESGVIACFGDGLAPQTVPGALASMEKHGAAVIPVLNPLPNAQILAQVNRRDGGLGLLAYSMWDRSAQRTHDASSSRSSFRPGMTSVVISRWTPRRWRRQSESRTGCSDAAHISR